MADTNKTSSSSSPKQPKREGTLDEEENLSTDTLSATGDIHEILRKLRRKEIDGLTHDPTNLRSTHAADHYFERFFLESARYARFFVDTWFGLLVTSFFGGLGPFDWFTMFVYAFGGTVVLFFVLIGCLIINSPILVNTYKDWSRREGGGLGIVNSSNPNLFKSLTVEQAEAGKEFLSADISTRVEKDTDSERHFNFDAAKLLLQFSAIVYEHPNESIRAAITATEQGEEMKGYKHRKSLFSMTPILNKAVTLDSTSEDKVNSALDSEGDGIIRTFCKGFGIDFEPLSELNSSSSAFAGVFWDPKSTWIVVAFKGTSPIEFGEWISDLNTKMSNVGSHIPGFRKVHKGFKDRVYPDDVSSTGGVRPYDTISAGVKALSKWLRQNNGVPGKPKINVWFTGHSLGCATASLVYCRALMRPKDIGKKSNLRDSYLFACPILSDRETVDVFNAKMLEDPKKPKTMWRITSNGDFVATCLPELGDYTSIAVSPTNAFAFAHLGTEIKLRDYPRTPNATGNHIYYGSDIHIESKFTKEEILAQREASLARPGEKDRIVLGQWLQAIPLIGRVIAHGCVFYWDQMERMGIEGTCEWVYN